MTVTRFYRGILYVLLSRNECHSPPRLGVLNCRMTEANRSPRTVRPRGRPAGRNERLHVLCAFNSSTWSQCLSRSGVLWHAVISKARFIKGFYKSGCIWSEDQQLSSSPSIFSTYWTYWQVRSDGKHPFQIPGPKAKTATKSLFLSFLHAHTKRIFWLLGPVPSTDSGVAGCFRRLPECDAMRIR